MIHSVFERCDLLKQWVSYLFVKTEKKKRRKVESYMFGLFFFFVYRNLSCLNDQICMVVAWKNYYVIGS